MSRLHQPVMLREVLDFVSGVSIPLNAFLDGTFGRGGHSAAILDQFSSCKVFGLDRDQAALDYGYQQLRDRIDEGRLALFKGNFHELKNLLKDWPNSPAGFDGILLDLGVSSPQLDDAARGFSFYHDGPLDMRMDQAQPESASDIVNNWSEKELSDLFYHLGEIKFPNKVVRKIVAERAKQPIQRTEQLAELIVQTEGWRKKGKHPATNYFLALRLQVNNELDGLKDALPDIVDCLSAGGRLVVLTFHSTEDRIVKNVFKSLKQQGVGQPVNKKVVIPTRDEIKNNPRSRSAKLRAFERSAA